MNVLLTHGWCRTAYSAAASLARAGHRVSVCASSRITMCRVSRFVAHFDLVPDPYADPIGYVRGLLAIVGKRKIDVLMPVHEDALAIRHYAALLPASLQIAAPSYESLALACDKWELLRTASAAGIPIPRTIAPETIAQADRAIAEMSAPFLIKTRRGNSGKGVFICHEAAEARARYRYVVSMVGCADSHLPVIQEYVEGQLAGCGFLARAGHLIACFPERYMRCKQKGFGTSVVREPWPHSEIMALTRDLAKALQWDGIGHLDFIVPAQGPPRLLEMNPRFWGALEMAVANGYDFPLALLQQTVTGSAQASCFQPCVKKINALWIAGELIACVDEIRLKRLRAPLESMRRIFGKGGPFCYDDLKWSDPIPFLFELCYYGAGYLRSGFDPNPILPAMLR